MEEQAAVVFLSLLFYTDCQSLLPVPAHFRAFMRIMHQFSGFVLQLVVLLLYTCVQIHPFEIAIYNHPSLSLALQILVHSKTIVLQLLVSAVEIAKVHGRS